MSEANEDEKLKGRWKKRRKKVKGKEVGRRNKEGGRVGRQVETKGLRWKDKR